MDQQRSETDAKDSALVKEHVERLKADQEKDTLTTELVAARGELTGAESSLASQKAECRRLQELLRTADQASTAASAEHGQHFGRWLMGPMWSGQCRGCCSWARHSQRLKPRL